MLKVKVPGYETWETDVALDDDVSVDLRLTPLTQTTPKKGPKSVSEPPIDTTYPGMVGKKK